jgi:hypothetical protein
MTADLSRAVGGLGEVSYLYHLLTALSEQTAGPQEYLAFFLYLPCRIFFLPLITLLDKLVTFLDLSFLIPL